MNKNKESKIFLGYLQIREVNVLIALVFIVIIMSIASPYFLREDNIFNVLRGMSTIGIMAIGQIMVIITGGIDLSVGSLMAASSMLTARLITMYSINPLLAVVCGLTFGVFLGTINGFIITRFKINPFITTLGMLSVGRGLTYLLATGEKGERSI